MQLLLHQYYDIVYAIYEDSVIYKVCKWKERKEWSLIMVLFYVNLNIFLYLFYQFSIMHQLIHQYYYNIVYAIYKDSIIYNFMRCTIGSFYTGRILLFTIDIIKSFEKVNFVVMNIHFQIKHLVSKQLQDI